MPPLSPENISTLEDGSVYMSVLIPPENTIHARTSARICYMISQLPLSKTYFQKVNKKGRVTTEILLAGKNASIIGLMMFSGRVKLAMDPTFLMKVMGDSNTTIATNILNYLSGSFCTEERPIGY